MTKTPEQVAHEIFVFLHKGGSLFEAKNRITQALQAAMNAKMPDRKEVSDAMLEYIQSEEVSREDWELGFESGVEWLQERLSK